jgi:uncharacterized protein involved in exopolysaccharide biosynthesis
MANSHNDIPDSQLIPTNTEDKTRTLENEIELIDYFRVVRREKGFIVLVALPIITTFAAFLLESIQKIRFKLCESILLIRS